MTSRIQLTALAIALAIGACSQRQAEVLDVLEAGVSMPAGASPLARYSRYYFVERSRGEQQAKIIGIYLASNKPSRRWAPFDQVPVIMDGGCAMVTVVFDARTHLFESSQCNGVA